MHPAASPNRFTHRHVWIAAAIVAALTLALFYPSLDYQFVNLDDSMYIVNNKNVKDGLSSRGVYWAFTTFHSANWHPLTWLSLQLDASLWRMKDGEPDPRGFHQTNVLLHAANAALVFLALRALTGCFWPSLMSAVLFAVHPLRVESVAWATERKDVLSAFFGLLTLWAYALYARQASARRYWLVAVPFALSLLAKPMLVTLPALLLVLDWWPLRRADRVVASAASPRGNASTAKSKSSGNGAIPAKNIRQAWFWLVVEKLPLFALAAAASVATFLAQSEGGAMRNQEVLSTTVRMENAILSYAIYLVQTVWPIHLAAFYPHPYYAYDGGPGLEPGLIAASAVLLLILTGAALTLRRRAPYLLTGWLWYLGTLVPVIGLVQVGNQGHADRYTYFPQIGIFVALCWEVAELARRRWASLALGSAAVAALALAILTSRQMSVWHDSRRLWENAYAVSGKCPTVLVNLGEMLDKDGDKQKAMDCYQEAVKLDPVSGQIRLDLGNAWQARGNLDNAAREFAEACKLDRKSPGGFTNLGLLLLRKSQLPEARNLLETARDLAPDLAATHFNLGLAEEQMKHDAQAAECYEAALRLQPVYPQARISLGGVLVRLGKTNEGFALLNEAVQSNPKSAEARFYLGKALASQGDLPGAFQHLNEALRLTNGRLTLARTELGIVLARQGRDAEALEYLTEVARRDRSALNSLRDRLRAANRPELAEQLEQRLPSAP
jgi:protein O-mannosyl-transferase